MSSTAENSSAPEPPIAVGDHLAYYEVERPHFDHDRTAGGRNPEGHRRVWLVARLAVSMPAVEGVTGPTATLALYATSDGHLSIRWADDDAARVDGDLAHSLIEPAERIRHPGNEALSEHFAGRVAAIGGDD